MGFRRILIQGIILFFTVSIITEKGECRAYESPEYTVVHSESDFEVRLYRESTWMSALANEISFEKATRDGFHRLFQYSEGANLNFSRMQMTVPVLTSIVPGAGPLHSSAYFVKLYLPLPELNLLPDSVPGHYIAVRKFSDRARDSNIVKEAQKLAVSLSRSPRANSTFNESRYAYSIAQYSSPFRFVSRVNEVWVDVGGSEAHGCGSSLVAAF